MTVTGDYTMGAEAIYEAEIMGDGTSDLIQVGGVATLDGTLNLTMLDDPDQYNSETPYAVLTAANGVSGEFNNITWNVVGIDGLTYPTQEIVGVGDDLNIILESTVDLFEGDAKKANQTEVAAGLAITAAKSTTGQALFGASASDRRSAMEEAGGNSLATWSGVMAADANEYLNTVASEVSVVAKDTVAGWGKFYSLSGTAASSSNARGYSHRNSGMTVGVGVAFSDKLTFGLHGGYSWNNGDFGKDNIKSNSKEVGAYVATDMGMVKSSVVYSHGSHDIESMRSITAIGLAGIASQKSSVISNKIKVAVKIPLAVSDNLMVSPIAEFNFVKMGGMAFTETGADVMNLSGSINSFKSKQSRVGFVGEFSSSPIGGRFVKPNFKAVYATEHGDNMGGLGASLAGAPDHNFMIQGLGYNKSQIEIDAGVNILTKGKISFSINYRGIYNDTINNHGVRAAVRIVW